MTSISRRTAVLGATGALAVPFVGMSTARAADASAPQPLERAHAHNDYEHDRPLGDALANGFTSVEADVWLVDGELYIGHDGPDLTRTLRSLYLEPLRARVRRAGHSTYDHWGGSLRLLIDVKSDGDEAYGVLQQQLSAYPDLVTVWRKGRRKTRPVTAVLSGELANRVVPQRDTRWFGFDGRIDALPAGANAEQIPLVSENWSKFFTWRGVGPMPGDQRRLLHDIVSGLHADGYQVRLWATPDTDEAARTAVWREEIAAGVDVLNTDHLTALRSFLLTEDPDEQ
ncbi:phosphatidylinositol-specific phospholipase C/glycerophosphodiester phosphodiesterase family protein [Demetria terragena]|uniref:phosphatidylinositol-specific phospholipase C/glycerophosphodiester phosphodiesterase family protein n=1 Tax=Demetria terragena TaxID=63959 RepID=UPI00039E03B4|nr:phosphatidylinositol-specific phospholipase C/glycerophosphodiester phosphodiesterase family protein [Demetria terragena]